MDRKTIIAVLVCLGLFFGLTRLIDKFFPPKTVTVPVATNAVPATQTVTLTNAQGVVQVITTNLAEAPTASASGRFIAETNTPEELMVVTNENARYTFTTHGGGLKLIELVGTSTKKELKSGHIPSLNAHVPVPVMAVLDGETVQGNGVFKLSPIDNGVRAEKELASGLRIVKEFVLSTNYLVSVVVRFENPSTQPLALPEQKLVVGTATLLSSDDQSQAEGAMWYNGSDTESMIGASYFAQRGFACMPRTPPAEYSGGQSNVYWASVHNQFFALVAMTTNDPAMRFIVRPIDLPRPTAEETRTNSRVVLEPKGYEGAMVYPALVIPPGQMAQRQFFLYAGPKEYRTLARIASMFNNDVDKVMGFGRFFGFFSKALLLGMNWLHSALNIPYGWAIIVITFIIKMLFWPLTLASTRSAKRMQALQPQMKALQEKHKDDPVKAQRKLMEFMKENKVSPLGGCLPMVLQMPVFIGFFYMIRSAIELRGASFLWVQDLSRPDTLFHIGSVPFNLLPLIMGATMLWQAHLTPPSPGMDPVQQKMMRYMPLIFLFFLYNYQAGLALYWTVNNLLTITQTKLTRMNPAKDAAAAKPAVLTPAPKKKK